MQRGCCGVVVDRDWRVHERGGCNQVLARGLISSYEGIGGLAWGNHNCVCFEWFHIGSIYFHNCELVPSNLEEELLIECSIDYAQ
ncbi:hypothetical protein IC582_020347 [Cucumis melo]